MRKKVWTLIAILITLCSWNYTTDVLAHHLLHITSGDNQVTTIGGALKAPLVFKVLGPNGVVLPAPVFIRVVSGGGQLSGANLEDHEHDEYGTGYWASPNRTTGEISMNLTLGDTVGVNKVEVILKSGQFSDTISFSAVAIEEGAYHVTLTSVDDLRQVSTTAETHDITYNFRVINYGGELDQVSLTIAGDADSAFLDNDLVQLQSGASDPVRLTIPREALLDAGTYLVSITATSQNDATATDTLTTTTVIAIDPSTNPTDPTDPADPTDPTNPTNPTNPTPPEQVTQKVILSEFMFESEGGEDSLPQWLEVYNYSISTVNLRGWKLQWKRLQPSLLEVTTTFKEDFIIPAQQSRLLVTSLGRHSEGGKLSDDDVYQLHVLHTAELAQDDVANRNRLITRGGFSLKLLNPKDELIDQIGTLNENKQTWQLHDSLIEGVRSSLIRRFDEGVPRSGIERRGWHRAIDAVRLTRGIYYGHSTDLGTPGYRRGKPLPVELSQFSAKFVKDAVVINWTTESELNNAGFNIFRSTSPTKNFHRINAELIQGAGTTGKRTKYEFVDKTAKPNVSYYYRIEDVDLSGTRGIRTTYRLRGVIAPTGKHITTWGKLKYDN